MNKIKQLRSTESQKKKELFSREEFFLIIFPGGVFLFTWLEELRVELLSTGARLPGVLPGADRRVVGLLRLAPGCGRPEHREWVRDISRLLIGQAPTSLPSHWSIC